MRVSVRHYEAKIINSISRAINCYNINIIILNSYHCYYIHTLQKTGIMVVAISVQ